MATVEAPVHQQRERQKETLPQTAAAKQLTLCFRSCFPPSDALLAATPGEAGDGAERRVRVRQGHQGRGHRRCYRPRERLDSEPRRRRRVRHGRAATGACFSEKFGGERGEN